MGSIGRTVLVFLWVSLVSSSPVMAEINIFDIDLRTKERSGSKDYGPVAIQCPNSELNSVILFSGNRNGIFNRYSVQYDEGTPVVVTNSIAMPGQDFGDGTRLDVRNLEPEYLEIALAQMEYGNTLLNEICNGSPEAKQRYRELLDSNLSILGLSPEDYPSNF